jgi:hypothetical protein
VSCQHNPLCCFSTSVYCCKCIFRYRLSPETFGYTLVFSNKFSRLPKVSIGVVKQMYICNNRFVPAVNERIYKIRVFQFVVHPKFWFHGFKVLIVVNIHCRCDDCKASNKLTFTEFSFISLKQGGKCTSMYPKVSGLAAWSENCKCYVSLPLGKVASLLYESI